MTEDEAKALLLLAGIAFTKLHRLENKYWPDHEDYTEVRRKSPWWLVLTPHGSITMGWRKRVISINWEDTPARIIVTKENVTKGETYVHAYNHIEALQHLTKLSIELNKPKS